MKKLCYLLIACFLSCKPELNKKEKIASKSLQNQIVIINGTSDEKGFNESIAFYDESFFYAGIHKELKKEINGDSITMMLEKIEKPKLFEIVAFGENTYYVTRVIITPGDSLRYTLKEGKLKFTGKNQEHYNFYLEMDPEIDDWSQIYLNKYNPDFKKYKKQCDSLYNKRLLFFNDFVKKHSTVSDEFKKKIRDELRFEYLVNITKPRSEVQGIWNVNTSEDIISIYERGSKQEGAFFDINGYLNNITLEEVNQPEYINNLYFKMSIVPLLRQYFVKSSETPYSIGSFKEELMYLEKNFNHSIVDYATGKLIVDYFNQGFGKDNITAEFMKNTIKVYKESIEDSSSITVMKNIELELSSINKVIPKEMNELVLNLSKDTVSFSYALQEKKIKVIDFWASWCQPCIEEIIVSKDKRERIATELNVNFLYLSIDKDTQKWIDKSVDLYQFLPDNQQFKVLSQKRSKLIEFLNLKNSFGISIPRYVILDKNNKIIDNNAPKPSKDNFEEILNRLQNK